MLLCLFVCLKFFITKTDKEGRGEGPGEGLNGQEHI